MKRHTLTIVWEGRDVDEGTAETLNALDPGDVGYLLRMGGIDVSDPTVVTTRTDEDR